MFHKSMVVVSHVHLKKSPWIWNWRKTWKILEGDLSVIFQADRSDFLTASGASWQVAHASTTFSELALPSSFWPNRTLIEALASFPLNGADWPCNTCFRYNRLRLKLLDGWMDLLDKSSQSQQSRCLVRLERWGIHNNLCDDWNTFPTQTISKLIMHAPAVWCCQTLQTACASFIFMTRLCVFWPLLPEVDRKTEPKPSQTRRIIPATCRIWKFLCSSNCFSDSNNFS